MLGTAVLVVLHQDARPQRLRDHPADPLTDGQASAQVVGAVIEIVRTAGLRDASGGYAFRSCKNAADPPYQAVVEMNFLVPQGDSVGYLDDLATTMTSVGWTVAESQPEHFGRMLTRAGLTAVFHRDPEQLDLASMRVYGECRVMTDHRADDPAWTELTDRLRRGG